MKGAASAATEPQRGAVEHWGVYRHPNTPQAPIETDLEQFSGRSPGNRSKLCTGDTWTVNPRLVLPPFIAGVLAAATLVVACGGGNSASQADQDKAIAEARVAFKQAQAGGLDLSRGPCISESLHGVPDWVADVAHDPRQDVDDDPANQCRSYRHGDTHHFVELTPDGQLIRAE
jgi:hypothetical protein